MNYEDFITNSIIFQKPKLGLIETLRDDGFMPVDMHLHSEFSDTVTKMDAIIKRAAKQEINVAVTDHNEVKGVRVASRNKLGVMVVPGMELTCIEGAHLLFYFYTISELEEFHKKHIQPNRLANPISATKLSVNKILEISENYNCIVSAPHPFGYKGSYCGLGKCITKHVFDESILKEVDALEVISGCMPHKLNKKAIDYTLKEKKAITGGSDSHSLFQLGRTVTCSIADNVDDFLDNILKKQNLVIGKETLFPLKVIPAAHILRAHMRHFKATLAMQYQIRKENKERMLENKQKR